MGQILSGNPQAVVCQEPEGADVVVVNTCGFLESAREEADEVLSQLAETVPAAKIIVVGCYPQLWRRRVLNRHPQLYAVMGTDALYRQNFWNDLLRQGTHFPSAEQSPVTADVMQRFEVPRMISDGAAYAYLKIGDGCSQHCTYCTIPRIKGPLVSRRMEAILSEAEELTRSGISEIILVAQNTSAYGKDFDAEHRSLLPELLQELDKLRDIKVLRLLYLYPTMITRMLLETIGASQHVAHYVDIPMQHTDPAVLRSMGRPWSRTSTVGLVQRVREVIPDAAVRSTFIVGFPGETEEQFRHLLDDLQVLRLDHASAFTYSRERLAASYGFSKQVHGSTKMRRQREFMELQQGISLSINRDRYAGKTISVILDDVGAGTATGRTLLDAPDVDNVVTLDVHAGPADAPVVGEIRPALIKHVGPYDLKGVLL